MLNKEGILLKELPGDIIFKIKNNKTVLGNNPAIPNIYDDSFLYSLLKHRFQYIKNELKKINSIDDIESNDLYGCLAELILKCKKIEKEYRPELEKICYNFIIDLFSIPKDIINLQLELKDTIDFKNNSILLDPIDNNIEFKLNDIDDAILLKNEIYKRKILIALCFGGAMEISSMIEKYQNKISKISNELCDIYKKILLINEYLIFEKENININEKNKMQIGVVEVLLGNEEKKVSIKAQATIFPILLFEAIKGFMELFISHGLPIKKERTLYILNKTDYLKSEPWYMRIGPSLWNLLTFSLNDIDSKVIPYLLKEISTLEVKEFNKLMQEIFTKTKKGEDILMNIVNKANDNLEYNHFIEKMNKMKTNKSIITDEYIHFDEL